MRSHGEVSSERIQKPSHKFMWGFQRCSHLLRSTASQTLKWEAHLLISTLVSAAEALQQTIQCVESIPRNALQCDKCICLPCGILLLVDLLDFVIDTAHTFAFDAGHYIKFLTFVTFHPCGTYNWPPCRSLQLSCLFDRQLRSRPAQDGARAMRLQHRRHRHRWRWHCGLQRYGRMHLGIDIVAQRYFL